jgi:hypothetical protein
MPAFFGCLDWHSAVHGHWLLAVAARRAQDAGLVDDAIRTLQGSITAEHVAAEAQFLRSRPTFERPYGIAWLCALHQELATTDVGTLSPMALVLSPLVEVAVAHIVSWLPKLTRPVRSGVHSQTAFALGLVLDWARVTGRSREALLFEARARELFGDDRDYATHLEPDGEDFLSPSLGAADLMSRVLTPRDLCSWLDSTMPGLGRGSERWLEPVIAADPRDGRLMHHDGLNLSRAWMLDRIARALPARDVRIARLADVADRHAEVGLARVSDEHYEGAHWLGTFAAYLVVGRSLEAPAA